jgi:Zn-dependent protease
LHLLIFLPDAARPWVGENLKNALVINVLLAIFNLLPLPPLDGGRIAVGLLPDALAKLLARLEPYGLMILIVVLFVLPLLSVSCTKRTSSEIGPMSAFDPNRKSVGAPRH